MRCRHCGGEIAKFMGEWKHKSTFNTYCPGSNVAEPLTENYTQQVKYTETNRYGCGPDDEDDVYTIAEFLKLCADMSFIDDDGFGYAVKNGLADKSVCIYPSNVEAIPKGATHIVWYNR